MIQVEPTTATFFLVRMRAFPSSVDRVYTKDGVLALSIFIINFVCPDFLVRFRRWAPVIAATIYRRFHILTCFTINSETVRINWTLRHDLSVDLVSVKLTTVPRSGILECCQSELFCIVAGAEFQVAGQFYYGEPFIGFQLHRSLTET